MLSLFSLLPIVAGLRSAGGFINQVDTEEGCLVPSNFIPTWTGVEGGLLQKYVLEYTSEVQQLIGLLEPDEIKALASFSCDQINKFLKDNGIDIQLQPWDEARKETFGFAGLLNLLRPWIAPGQKNFRLMEGKLGFRLDTERHQLGYRKTQTGELVIVVPAQKRDDFVYFTQAPKGSLEGHDLIEFCRQRFMSADFSVGDYSGVILPKWTFQKPVDVSGMLGLSARSFSEHVWRLTQALMEGLCTLNSEGVHFKAAFAAAATREAFYVQDPRSKDYLVNHDVVMWLGHKNIPMPYGAVQVGVNEFC